MFLCPAKLISTRTPTPLVANFKLLSITYETTDTYEFSDDFACELAENINDVVTEFLANVKTS